MSYDKCVISIPECSHVCFYVSLLFFAGYTLFYFNYKKVDLH